MLYSTHAITKVKLRASDGAYGDIKDVYFDDISWVIRYFVVDIGTWRADRLVLISPEALTHYSEDDKAFHTKLTRQQIADSPPSDSEKTVSRQHEERLSQYYGWSPYWTTPLGAYPWPGIYSYPPYGEESAGRDRWQNDSLPPTVGKELQARIDQDKDQDVHLRSFNEVRKYGLRATDGDLGILEDLLIEPESWRVTHVIADARRWWPGGEVVIDRGLVQNIDWYDQKIEVAMTRDEVKNAPPYDRDQGITESYQMALSHYYRRFKDRTLGTPPGGVAGDYQPGPHA
ncbi:hypothetical protein [Oligoflexus tunisiensis]|uniref:hypothetical protein n=1 Tax=Oligoflexus tunisiensis TaxID=708132 RepID=UPI00114D0AB9|nr:hypothetical protein [Oligoflexus tunisiensis]